MLFAYLCGVDLLKVLCDMEDTGSDVLLVKEVGGESSADDAHNAGPLHLLGRGGDADSQTAQHCTSETGSSGREGHHGCK